MTIALLCPNGHKLTCSESQAGKRGKCPQCGTTFRVPELSDSGSLPLASNPSPEKSSMGLAPKPVPVAVDKSGIATWSQPADAPAAPAEKPASSPKIEQVPLANDEPAEEESAAQNPIRVYHDGDATADDEVLFLCPNGHQLCGPISLAGSAGECPECGTEFLLPTEEELDESAEDQPAEMDQLIINMEGGPAVEEEEDDERDLGRLFDSLWFYRSQGATLELHLGDGKVLIPDGYAPHLSKQGQGVFMRREGNGSYTITAVDWEAVRYVAVRNIRDLPEGVFDQPTG